MRALWLNAERNRYCSRLVQSRRDVGLDLTLFLLEAEIKGLSLGGKDLRVSFLDKPATAPQQNSSKQARASIHPHATSRSPSTSGSCRVACCRPPPEQAAVAPAPTSRSQREIPSHKLPRIANAMHKKMLAPPGGFSHNIFG
eukprot:TRINITY_DN12562_c0_g1_i1.p1 TRINITY_DN12562_c0_g1~~TRINITY_DN12562_c0_g1_i1.p1  ORF type:complete len:142 (+),score=6.53 TRINITY_DN12562_c0_g1_i1:471-896(+)